MREFKFRAWTGNEFIPFGLFSDEVIKYVDIQQYTGLKDRNGSEIYEGDILEIKPNYLFKIIWHEESWGYKVIKNDAIPVCGYIKGHVSRGGLKHYNISSKVIGNIYETPELLEGDRDE